MTEPKKPPADITHTTLSVLFLALLVVSTFWVLSPFLSSLLWAVIVCVAVWPLFLRLEQLLGGRRRVAVAIVTSLLLLTVFVPVTLAVMTLVNNTENLTAGIRAYQSTTLPLPPAWVAGLPIVGHRIDDTWSQFATLDADQRWAQFAPYAQTALQWFAIKAGGIGTMLIQFLLTAIISAIVLANGESVRDMILRFSFRLGGQHAYDVTVLAGRTIRSVVLGVLGTALVQTTVGAAGLLIAGAPAVGLLIALMLILCLAQLGPLLVLVPVVAWLFWSDQTVTGSVLAVIALVAGTLDSVVRPALIKRGADLPLLLIFAGVIGGLIAFGIVGLFIGPVVLAVAHTLLTNWVETPEDPGAV